MGIYFNDSSTHLNDSCEKVVFPFVIRSLSVVSLSSMAKIYPDVSALCQLMPYTQHSCRGKRIILLSLHPLVEDNLLFDTQDSPILA